MRIYRQGATGAILDIYEQVINDLKQLIQTIPDSKLTVTVFPESTNGCESLQAILSHVVYSGFGYATSINNSKENQLIRPEKRFHFTVTAYLGQLDAVFNYTEKILKEFDDHELEQLDSVLKIKTNWGQLYDVEQLMEHAIVHMMRHTRQIEKLMSL